MKLLFVLISFCCVSGQSTYWTKEKKKELGTTSYIATYYIVAVFKNPVTIKTINEFEEKNKYEAIAKANNNFYSKEKLNMVVFKDLLFKDKNAKATRALKSKINGNQITLCYEIEKEDFESKHKAKFFIDFWSLQINKEDFEVIKIIERRMLELEFVATIQHELYQNIYVHSKIIFKRLVELEKENAKLREEIKKLKEK